MDDKARLEPILTITQSLRNKINREHKENLQALTDIEEAIKTLFTSTPPNQEDSNPNKFIITADHHTCYTDGSGLTLDGSKVFGAGVFFNHGHFLNQSTKCPPDTVSTLHAEIYAVQLAIETAVREGIRCLHIKLDNLAAKTKLTNLFEGKIPTNSLLINCLTSDPALLRSIQVIASNIPHFTSLKCSWLKSHTGNVSADARFNDEADHLAKAAAASWQAQDDDFLHSPNDQDLDERLNRLRDLYLLGHSENDPTNLTPI